VLISPEIASHLVERIRAWDGQSAATTTNVGNLSKREMDVLRLAAAGKENAEIAVLLFLSIKTVKNHMSSIFRKLQLKNRIEAGLYAIESGIVAPRGGFAAKPSVREDSLEPVEFMH